MVVEMPIHKKLRLRKTVRKGPGLHGKRSSLHGKRSSLHGKRSRGGANQNNRKQNIHPQPTDDDTWMKLTKAFIVTLRTARQKESVPPNIPDRLFKLKYVESNANMDNTFGLYIKWRLDTYAEHNNLLYEDYGGRMDVYNFMEVYSIIADEYDTIGEEPPEKIERRYDGVMMALEKEWEMVVNHKRESANNNSNNNNNNNSNTNYNSNNNIGKWASSAPYVYGTTYENNAEERTRLQNMMRTMYLKHM